MDWLDTPTKPAIPLALKKKDDQSTPQKIREISAELPGLGEMSAQAVTPSQHNQFAERPLAGMVQPVLPHENRRRNGKGEASMKIQTKSDKMAEVLHMADAAAKRSEATIIITGETGTGKTTLAQHIWQASPRAGKPFVRVCCTNISQTIGEAELFGHASRAFTGAGDAKRGAIEAADGGVLFLDEIGELSLEMQAKLLDLVDNGTFHPVGSTQTRRVDVRIISATHCDLPAMVAAGTFRQDLHQRLAKISLHMPALRDRFADMPDIVRAMVGKREILPEVLDILSFGAYGSGNFRELDGVLERAHLLSWGVAEARAAVRAMGNPPCQPLPLAPPRMLAEDRLSVARELSAARAESGGWWTTLELAAAAGVARRTAAKDLHAWITSGEVAFRGEKKCRHYRACDGIGQQMPTNANKRTPGEDVG